MFFRNRERLRSGPALLECLESRVLLSATHPSVNTELKSFAPTAITGLTATHKSKDPVASPIAIVQHTVSPNSTSPPGSAYTPAQIRQAYGFDQVTFGSVVGNGAGQTIAIVDAYDDPNIASDLAAFDSQFGITNLPSFTFTKMSQTGSTTALPAASGTTQWAVEESLDVEWAHAMAPGAKIILVEANDPSYGNLMTGATAFAATIPGVSVVSLSFGGGEFLGEGAYDSTLTTPFGHAGVTFLASTGDAGAPVEYPAASPNAISVGGTTLTLTASNDYAGETGWSGSGGGISQVETRLPYQNGIVTQSNTQRTAPDISADADPNTGVAVYDSYDFAGSPWAQIGGTSLATPLMAGMIAIANQGRAIAGLTSLDGPSQTLPLLYQLPAGDFHDITSGSNSNANSPSGFSAGVGYDLVTGRGSPIVNKVVYGLIGTGSVSGTVFQDNNTNGVKDSGDPAVAGTLVYIDSNNNGILETGTTTTASNTTSFTLLDGNKTGISSPIAISGASNTVSNVTVTLSIAHTRDSDLSIYLISPDGNQMLLAAGVGGTGANFTHTTFSDQAATSISSGTAPFSGSFIPTDALADFIGKSANGTWRLRVADTVRGNTGTLQSWSLSVTTGAADLWTTTSNASGAYAMNNLPLGVSYNVREIVPAGDIQTTPNAGSGYASAPLFTNITGQNFGNFSTIFNTTTNTDSYYVAVDPTDTYLQISQGTTASTTPTYQIALTKLGASSLTFNLLGINNVLVVDYANGSPIPGGNISLNATAASNDELRLFGQNPSQLFTMTDTQIGLASGGIIYYQNLPTLTLANSTTNFTGTLSTLQNLNINSGETFYFN